MYMRVTHAQYADPATLDSEAATQLWQELSSHVRGLPGNQSYTRGLDRASGRTIAISIWDTEEHAKSLSSTSDFVSRLQALGMRIEPSDFFEVRA